MTKKTISLSKYLGLSRKALEKKGVFDATLGIDTKLFVDPKLLINCEVEEFRDARKLVISYFNKLIKIHQQSIKSTRLREAAINMLAISEPVGLSIGYGNKSDKGTSISHPLAEKILLSASEILAVGIEDVEFLEILGLFIRGFGPDSISDLTINIVYHNLCSYTERIANELSVKTYKHTVDGTIYKLPKHPFSDKQLIFIPYRLLRALPVASSWEEIAIAASHNQELRKQFNEIIQPAFEEEIKNIKSKEVEEFKATKENLNKLLDIYKKIIVEPYNLDMDQSGYYHLQPFVDNEAQNIKPSQKPKNLTTLIDCVRELVFQFKRSIENNGANTLLYRKTPTGALDSTKIHHEDIPQIIFYLIADVYCSQTDILLSREPNAGLGPVDFSLGKGYRQKIVVEIKKSNNKSLIDGFEKQVVAYQKSENASYSFYVVILVKKSEKKKNSEKLSQLDILHKHYEDRKSKGIRYPELIIVDGLIYPSPSKL